MIKYGTNSIKRIYKGSNEVSKVAKGTNVIWTALTPIDPDYQNVLNLAASNSVTLPTTEQQQIDNQIMIGLKASDAWNKMDAFVKWNGTASALFRSICWKRLIFVDVIAAVQWNNTGLKGAGGYVDFNYTPSIDAVNFSLNNAGILFVANTNVSGDKATYGALSAQGNILHVGNRANNLIYDINSAVTTRPTMLQKIGINGLYRDNANSVDVMTDVITNLSAPVTGLTTRGLFAFGYNSSGNAVGLSDIELSYFAIGASFKNEHEQLKTILT